MVVNVLVIGSGTACAVTAEAGGSSSQALSVGEVFPVRSMAAVRSVKRTHRMVLRRKSRVGFVVDSGMNMLSSLTRSLMHAVAAVKSEVTQADAVESASKPTPPVVGGGRPELFVGLPLDTVSNGRTVNHTKAISAGLKALKLLGADGVEVPVWWGVVEKEAMGEYDWTSYLELAQMIHDAGLKIHVSLYFHASQLPGIPLPTWVSTIGDSDPDIYFADKQGRRNKECLSLAVDDLPVLAGKTPLQVYGDFCASFQASFAAFMADSTITDVSIGLGPGGELRYPSMPATKRSGGGVGEFQCYGKHMLTQLQKHADESGNHYWGFSGPHDAPQYDESPEAGNFFKENCGSWETPYGDFFLTWYSTQLLSHGERLLSMASSVFGSSPVTLSGKIPLAHTWYKTRAHSSEQTAGYHNTDKRDGYDAVADMFSRNSCRMILSGMELSHESHQALLSQIKNACQKHNVGVSGENSSISGASDEFIKIKENILGGQASVVDSFTYQRMGASFFSPENWPRFTEFVRSIGLPELHSDDVASGGEGSIALRITVGADKSSSLMQAG